MRTPEYQLTRRGFLAFVGTAALASRGGGIVVPYTEKGEHQFENVPKVAREHLASLNLMTIAHREGNSIEGIIKTGKAGGKFAEIDAREIDDTTYADHGQGISLPKSDDVLIGIDQHPLRIRFGNPQLEIGELAQSMRQAGIGGFVDLKRGDYEDSDIRRIDRTFRDSEVPVMYHAADFKLIKRARNILKDPMKIAVMPENKDEWNEAIYDRDVKLIFTNPESVYPNKIQALIDNKKQIILGPGSLPLTLWISHYPVNIDGKRKSLLAGLFNSLNNLKALNP